MAKKIYAKMGKSGKKFTLFSLGSAGKFRLDFCLEATIVVKLLVSFCYLTCTYFRLIGLVSLVANYWWLFLQLFSLLVSDTKFRFEITLIPTMLCYCLEAIINSRKSNLKV